MYMYIRPQALSGFVLPAQPTQPAFLQPLWLSCSCMLHFAGGNFVCVVLHIWRCLQL